jgi:hypothetical protein
MSERIGTKMLQGTAEPVNPQFHDEFIALCALFYSGEISDEEWALLQIHMQFCDACHERFMQYQHLTSSVIPAMAAVAAEEFGFQEESEASIDAAEKRLMNLIDSTPIQEIEPKRISKNWLQSRTLFVLAAAMILCTACVLLLHKKSESQSSIADAPGIPKQSTAQASVATDEHAHENLQRTQGELRAVQQQLQISETERKDQSVTLKQIEQQLSQEQGARKELSDQKEAVSKQLAEVQAEAVTLRTRLNANSSAAEEQTIRFASLEKQVRELRTSLEEKDAALNDKDRMLALDQDFLSHDREIRDLIGARNLYIADIFDTRENGKTAKQFGRIFYTKDRSLVFYGFDLDSQPGRTKDVSYQVWGSGSDRAAPVSLGLFYQDDTHKRWVLRCNDSKSLSRLDTVFVTVEPLGGSAKPTTKPLLRAYLQIQPNHP